MGLIFISSLSFTYSKYLSPCCNFSKISQYLFSFAQNISALVVAKQKELITYC
jgi:hypothetical protein